MIRHMNSTTLNAVLPIMLATLLLDLGVYCVPFSPRMEGQVALEGLMSNLFPSSPLGEALQDRPS